MKKLIFLVLLVLVFSGCVDDDSVYYPVGNTDVLKGGSDAPIDNSILLARSYNIDDYISDTALAFPNNKIIGKLTFKYDLLNPQVSKENPEFLGVGQSIPAMSLSYYDGNFADSLHRPLYVNTDTAKRYRVKFHLSGDFHLTNQNWMIDNIYVMLSNSFLPYPPETSDDVFLCKGNLSFLDFYTIEGFNGVRRAGTFNIDYDRWDLKFQELYFNVFVNLIGHTLSERVTLKINKESYFEIYEIE